MRMVVRSVALLSEDTKANAVSSAPRIQTPRSKVASVSAIAPRRTTLRLGRVLRGGLGLHAADVARQMYETTGALDLDRLAHGADRQRRFGNRHTGDRLLELTPIDHLPQDAADISGKLGAELAALARGFRHRQAHARRRSGAERGIGAGGDRQA